MDWRKKMNDEIRIESIKSEIANLLGSDRTSEQKANCVRKSDNSPPYSSSSFAGLLRELVNSDFPEEEAEVHWKKILANYNAMKESLHRDVGVRIAAYDYFLNCSEMFRQAILVDHGFIRRLRHSTLIDSLTGAFNRSFFELHLKKEIKRAIRYNRLFSLLLLDLDEFKALNENRGQDFCDELIVRLVKLLKESCREEDLLCRFGLDEFIFFLPETSGEGAYHFGERILYKIREDKLFIENEISVSGGIAEYPNDSRNIFNLIKCADSALYHAKAKGKDKISFYRERNELSSIYDGLTGLFNHSHFESMLAKEHARAVRHGLTYSMLMLDIDQFNKVNDDEGSVFGDLALTQFACLLQSKCRELDVLARIGGGHFMFLLPETSGDAASVFAERLRGSILDKCSFNDSTFTFSCGIASYPFDGFDCHEIGDCARKACAQATKDGGNRIVRYTYNRRTARRYKKVICLKYKLFDAAFADSKQRDFVTEDISIHGVRCTGSEELSMGMQLILLFKCRGTRENSLVILAKIVWVKQNGKASFDYGLEIQETDDAKVERLKEIIKDEECI
jgi:diguanylate cyclase (GGDEF)-like protein